MMSVISGHGNVSAGSNIKYTSPHDGCHGCLGCVLSAFFRLTVERLDFCFLNGTVFVKKIRRYESHANCLSK